MLKLVLTFGISFDKISPSNDANNDDSNEGIIIPIHQPKKTKFGKRN